MHFTPAAIKNRQVVKPRIAKSGGYRTQGHSPIIEYQQNGLQRASSLHSCTTPFRSIFGFTFWEKALMLMSVTAEMFSQEIAEAMKAYEKYIICIDKTPAEFGAALLSLLNKAITAYESRGPQLRHGIALDKQVTVILSQADTPRPLCGIYFNLHSPYQKHPLPKTVKPLTEPIGGGQPKAEG